MGLKHLRMVSQYLKKQDLAVTRGRMRRDLKINTRLLYEALEYLEETGAVLCIQHNQLKKYKWIATEEHEPCVPA